MTKVTNRPPRSAYTDQFPDRPHPCRRAQSAWSCFRRSGYNLL